jgi:transposase
MATRFVNVDRDTSMLLPPDLRDWVPDEDMVHFVIEAVAGMNLPALKVNRRGCGSEQYPPKMMLTLLIYCYANGIFSSRRIERATYRDLAVRFLTADTHPDHDTICTFRRENFEAVAQAFLHVLQLARTMGVLKIGTVSVDGTHIQANASKNRNVRHDRARQLERQLETDVKELMERAEQADHSDDDSGQSIPEEIARRENLRQTIQAAREYLENKARDRALAKQPEYEDKVRQREGREHKGREIHPPQDTPDDHEQVNLTDHDSRLMRKSKREGYTQSYNAQAAVDADGSQLILSNHVTLCASDANELEPAVNNIPASVGTPETVLADTGYANADTIERMEKNGKDLYVAVSRNAGGSQRRYDFRPDSVTARPEKKITDPRMLAMKEKLSTEEGKRIYAKRKHTVEPVFGIIKQVMGYRQTLLRGFEKISGDWGLVCLAYNVKRLFSLKIA